MKPHKTLERPPFELGDLVQVTPAFEFYGEWANETFVVIGLALSWTGHVNVTIAERPDARTVHGWSGPTDGFAPHELRKVYPEAMDPSATCEPSNPQYLPLVLEEAGEVVQAAGKVQRFGWDCTWPGLDVTNDVAMAMEVGDLLEVVDRLGLPQWAIDHGRYRKRRRLETYGPDVIPLAVNHHGA